MDKDKFVKAIELNKEIEEFETHKKALESSNIQYGGGLIFTYNSMHNDVPLKKEIFGEDFFKNYMEALDNFLEENEQYFDDLED